MAATSVRSRAERAMDAFLFALSIVMLLFAAWFSFSGPRELFWLALIFANFGLVWQLLFKLERRVEALRGERD